MADAPASGAGGRKVVKVQVLSFALNLGSSFQEKQNVDPSSAGDLVFLIDALVIENCALHWERGVDSSRSAD